MEYKILTHVYRSVHGLSPGYLNEMLPAYSPGRKLAANGMFLQTRVSKTVTRVLGLQHLKCGTVCLCVLRFSLLLIALKNP